MKRRIKLFSLILSLILITVSVPMPVYSENTNQIKNPEQITEIQEDLTLVDELFESQEDLDIVTQAGEFLEIEEDPISIDANSSDSTLVTGIPDGIYAIESAYISMNYMYFNSAQDSTKYITYSFLSSISPTIMVMPLYLFKITRVPNTDRYIIRLMADQSLTLDSNGIYVIAKNIPLDDSQVEERDTFNIICDNGSYLIKNVGNQQYICGDIGNYIVPSSSAEAYILSHWRFRGYRSYIEDGVYAFENFGITGKWASTQNDSYETGAYIQQKAYDNCPIDNFLRDGMFKINRIGNTDQYIIRPMTNNLLAWSFDGTNIITQNIPSSQEDIPDSMRFYIAYDNGSYMLIPYTSSINSVSLSQDTGCLCISQINATTNGRWIIYRYTGPQQSDIKIIGSEHIESKGAIIGQLYNFKVVCWDTELNMQNCFLALSSEYMDIADLTWDDINNTAVFKVNTLSDVGLYVGLSTISNGSIHIYITDHIIYKSVLPEQTIYLQNSYSQKYASVSELSMDNGVIIHQDDFVDESIFQWKIEHAEGFPGYIRFKSLYSNKYLGVSSDSTLICQYNSLNDNTLWKLIPLDNGSYKMICKATESSDMALSISSNSKNNGALLSQRSYTVDSNDADEWNLITKVLSYVNYYDSTLAENTTIQQLMPKANEFCNLVFARSFGIGMCSDNEPCQYHTIADDCTQDANSPCSSISCGTECGNTHHKNIFLISDQLYNEEREDNYIYILWSNRSDGTYCKNQGSSCIEVDALALVCNKRPIVQVLSVLGNINHKYISYMGLILAHETAHVFGIDDVYDVPGHDVSAETICIMEKFETGGNISYNFYRDIFLGNTNPFCDSCMEKMLEYTKNISIEGNQGGN